MRSSVVAVLILAACGSSGGVGDAGDDSAAGDGLGPDELTVTTRTRCCTGVLGEPAPGIEIIAIDPDGTTRMATTDGAGNATLAVERGASVTAVYALGSYFYLSTFVAVAPGDHLEFGEGGASWGEVTASMRASYPVSSAQTVVVYHACGPGAGGGGAGSNFASIDRWDRCAPASVDLHYVGYDASSSLIEWGVQQSVPFVGGGTTTLASWKPPRQLRVTAQNLPPEVSRVALTGMVRGADGHAVYPIGNLAIASGPPSGGMFVRDLPLGDGGAGMWSIVGSSRTGYGDQVATADLAATATVHVEPAPVTLPWSGAIALDPATQHVTWPRDGSGTYDGAYLRATWIVPSSGGDESYAWTLVVPPDRDAELDLPRLPAAYARYLPPAGVALALEGERWDFATVADYDELRQRPEALLTRGDLALELGPYHGSKAVDPNMLSSGQLAEHAQRGRRIVRAHTVDTK